MANLEVESPQSDQLANNRSGCLGLIVWPIVRLVEWFDSMGVRDLENGVASYDSAYGPIHIQDESLKKSKK
jgi:hypothetical protein